MIRLLLVSLVLLGIVIALRVRGGTSGKLRTIRVTARTALHRGAVLAVVEVDGKRLLIGAGSQQVNLLAELDDAPPPPAPSTMPAIEPTPTASTSVLERIRRATTRTPS